MRKYMFNRIQNRHRINYQCKQFNYIHSYLGWDILYFNCFEKCFAFGLFCEIQIKSTVILMSLTEFLAIIIYKKRGPTTFHIKYVVLFENILRNIQMENGILFYDFLRIHNYSDSQHLSIETRLIQINTRES